MSSLAAGVAIVGRWGAPLTRTRTIAASFAAKREVCLNRHPSVLAPISPWPRQKLADVRVLAFWVVIFPGERG